MRIGLFSARFWGIYLILFGLIAITRHHLAIDVSVARVAISLLLVWTGLMIILDRQFSLSTKPGTILLEAGSRPISAVSGTYNCVLAQARLDVQQPGEGEGRVLEVNTIFGMAAVHAPSTVPLQVTASAAFGNVITPDGTSTYFGDHTYRSPGYSEASRFVRINVSAVFGSVQIITDPAGIST
ncbi:MAG: LiaF-related protein [Bacillota bacterium]